MTGAAWGQTEPEPEVPAPVEQPAAEPESDLPSAESLFEKHIEAMGGREAIESITSREITGRVRNDTQNFLARIHIWSVAPDKLRTEVDAPGMAMTTTVYDGEIGWKLSDDNYQLVVGDALVDLTATSDFFGEANYKERYKEIVTLGKAVFNDREVYRVGCRAKSGKKSIAIFDVETGFVVGAQTTIISGGGPVQAILVLSDYEDIGGMMWPRNIIQITPGGETFISYRKIEINEIDDTMFERPTEVDELVAARKESGG